MASAYSSLRKMKKAPLPGMHKMNQLPPIESSVTAELIESEDITTSMLLEEVTKDIVATHMRHRKSPASQRGDLSNRSVPTPSFDTDLMTSMASRLASLESQVRFQKKQLLEKDKMIDKLHLKIKALSLSADAHKKPENVQALERKCLMLQSQVNDMEEFLADYGMVWVGENDIAKPEEVSGQDTVENKKTNAMSTVPDSSIDFDLLVAKLNDLNFLSGEGIAKIQHTVAGARLKIPDPVNFILYSNGMILFNGPFRPYTDRTTQQLIRDIMDGYFPTELQSRYPDGVVFKLTDKRDIYFKNTLIDRFEGEGYVLGGQTTQSCLLQNDVVRSVETSIPGPKMNVDQFLNRLPRTVIKSGKVVDIRNSVRESLYGTDESPPVITTESGKDSDVKKTEDSEERTSTTSITTLKIKLEDGNSVLLLKLQSSDTIGDVKKHINKKHKLASSSYDIVSGVPIKVYDNESETLVNCGLTPSALLYVRRKKS